MMPKVPFTVLHIDLTEEITEITQISDQNLLKKLLGGRGIGTYWFLENVKTDVDPLSAENPLLFAPGVLTGTVTPCSGRTSIIFKSPATKRFFKTNVGGHFGAQLKFAGYDLLIVQGKAKRPVYISIDNEKVEIRDADELWGLDVRETNRILREQHDEPELQLACIGPAGENGVMYASIQVSIYNAAGRGGGGLVMGNKNLKAVAVKGTKSVEVEKPQEFMEVISRLWEKMAKASGVGPLSDYGTSIGVESTNAIGAFPVKNFTQGSIEGVEKLTGTYLVEGGFLKRKIACYSCPVGCHRFVTIDNGKHRGTYTGGPEYETLSALGGGCLSTDTEGIIKANELCNIYGLDTISTGNSIQWLMECYERGVIGKAETEGLEVRWGDSDIVIQLVEKIARREGIGDLLAKGLERASAEMGKDSYKWAIQARGLEQSRVETRSAYGYALAFAVSSRGPDHLNTECLAEFGGNPESVELIERITGDKKYAYPHTTEKRAEIVRWHEDIYAASDSLGICAFATTAQYWVEEKDLADLFSAATGIDISAEEIMRAGQRIIVLERCFNGSLGYTRDDDVLPYRLMNEEQQDAMHENAVNSAEKLEGMKDEYFKLHQWDIKTGLPETSTLEKLDLLDIVESIVPFAQKSKGEKE